MGKWLRRGFWTLVILAASNLAAEACALPLYTDWRAEEWILVPVVLLLALLTLLLVRPIGRSPLPTRRIRQLAAGVELLRLFLVTATVDLGTTVWFFCLLAPWTGVDGIVWLGIAAQVLMVAAVEAAVFWSGMIRIYITSTQLGIRHRVLAALCGWVPFLNIWYLCKLIRIASDEVEFETEKWELDAARAESEICKTRYPILMVHGVFFVTTVMSTIGAASPGS